ncbi:DUF3592 domain-containing protein [Corallococcus aberystwythensis]|nr:DUF3592 domain-containing protein [Corallococcus aberystwythensis]
MNLTYLLFSVGVPFAMLVFIWRRYDRTQRLRQEGMRVQGTVLRIDPADSDSPAVLHYRFELPDGTPLTNKYQQHRESWAHLTPGAPIDIDYLPGNPKHNQPAGKGTSAVEFVLWAAVIVLFAMLSVGMNLRDPESPAEAPPQAAQPVPLKAYAPPSP